MTNMLQTEIKIGLRTRKNRGYRTAKTAKCQKPEQKLEVSYLNIRNELGKFKGAQKWKGCDYKQN